VTNPNTMASRRGEISDLLTDHLLAILVGGFALVSLALLGGCSGDSEVLGQSYQPLVVAEDERIDWNALLEPAERPVIADEVSGAASRLEEQAPASSEGGAQDLGSRVDLRPLALPTLRRGVSSGFDMEDGRRGWVASLPASTVLLTPAYGEGRVYVGGGFSSTTMYALDAQTGQVEWSLSTPRRAGHGGVVGSATH